MQPLALRLQLESLSRPAMLRPKSAIQDVMKRIASVVLWSVLLTGCAGGELTVGADHPASPRAPGAPLPELAALSSAYGSAETPAPVASVHEHGHATPTATVYTCPMHSEITRSEPGSCPICKMDLVPKKDTQ